MTSEEEKEQDGSAASKRQKTVEPQLWSKVVCAPLNEHFALVCGPATFGPIQVKACIIDGACATDTLLPWPDDPDAQLNDLFRQSDLYSISAGKVGVVGCSLNIKVKAENPKYFHVVLDGVSVRVFQELRLVITEEARRWLESRGVRGLPPKGDPHIYPENLDCVLVGQQVLENLVSLQIESHGMLLINPHEFKANPAPCDYVKAAKTKLYEKRSSAYYREFLSNLRKPGAIDNPFRPPGTRGRPSLK